jgi:muramoyltetrapeptide carboxypeptidase
MAQLPKLKPRALRPGDSVAIVAPASSFNRDDFNAGCEALRRLGYLPVYDNSIFDRELYFAGSPERRVRELEQAFADDRVKAIVSVRGGYGSNYLLEKVDITKIAAHPKIFVGYSDLTSLMTYFYDRTGLVTFHGPMVAKDFAKSNGVDISSWRAALEQPSTFNPAANATLEPLAAGKAEGILYGGCLSMLAESLGTPYEIHPSGTILFIEDLATKPYQIDRMLMHLKLAGKLNQVRGLVFGEMLDCRPSPAQGYSLEELIRRVIADLDVPVAYGLRSGHVSRENITLPMGVNASLSVDTSTAKLEILEPATIA